MALAFHVNDRVLNADSDKPVQVEKPPNVWRNERQRLYIMSYTGYEPLDATRDHIRLLQIDAPQPDQPDVVSVSMRVVSLGAEPTYNALSYAWGDQTCRRDILVDGHPVSVTASLATGLQACRDRFGADLAEVGWWADAICINQADLAEKTHQIGLMSRIFSEAAVVVAWLGPQSHDTAHAISQMRKLSRMLGDYDRASRCLWLANRLGTAWPGLQWLAGFVRTRTSRLHSGGWLKSNAQVKFRPTASALTVDTNNKSNLSPRTKQALEGLLGRSYWTRVWTFQEIVLAKTVCVLCGEHQVLWEDIETLGGASKFSPLTPSRAEEIGVVAELASICRQFLPIVKMRAVYRQRRIGSIGEATEAVWDRVASDPRDMVFGVLALSQTDMKPDYALSVGDLYRHVTVEKLRYTGMLTDGIDRHREGVVKEPSSAHPFPLYLAGTARHQGDREARRQRVRMASWVEDLTSGMMPDKIVLAYRAAGQTAIRDTEACSMDNGSLSLRVHIIGQIERAEMVTPSNFTKVISQIIPTWLEDQGLPSLRDPTVFDKLYDVVHLGLGFTLSSVMGAMEDDLMLLQFLLSLKTTASDESIYECIEMRLDQLHMVFRQLSRTSTFDFASNYFSHVPDKSFIGYTTDGNFLSAARDARPGDQVCLVPGHPCPFVIRPSEKGYRLVTWAYVQGAMRGEIVGKDEKAWLSSLVKIELQ